MFSTTSAAAPWFQRTAQVQHHTNPLNESHLASTDELRRIPLCRTDILPNRQESSDLHRRYETLSRLSKSFTLGTPEAWVDVLTSELSPILNFDFIDVVVFDKDGGKILWSLRANERKTDNQLPIQESVFWCVYDHQKPLWIEDSDADQSCAAAKRLKQLRPEYRSFYGLPLSTPNGCLGALGLASSRPNSFTTDDLEFLAQVANQLSLAVENWLARRAITDLQNKIAQCRVSEEDETIEATNFDGIIGKSSSLRKALKQIETVAPTNSNVLIWGETGTGKELVARAIHQLGSRRSNAFVTVNCAAIPTGLLESELFGHERGAFTGAISQRIGRFEAADKGTIFLDEIGEIPIELQPKLLRVLQQREFERLGNGRTLRTDVRLIAATNRDLKIMVDEQKFRSDLFYRLNVFPIRVPPLRDRPEDIPLLVRYFTQRFSRQMDKNIETVPPEAMEALSRYCWPGNIRELENVIERAVIVSSGPILKVALEELCNKPMPNENEAAFQTLEDVERTKILATLKQTKWVLSGPNGAAIRLGLNRSTLYFRMKKLGIIRPI
jgi:transcriptional regulator with GAF, ATPase, and Fis domain